MNKQTILLGIMVALVGANLFGSDSTDTTALQWNLSQERLETIKNELAHYINEQEERLKSSLHKEARLFGDYDVATKEGCLTILLKPFFEHHYAKAPADKSIVLNNEQLQALKEYLQQFRFAKELRGVVEDTAGLPFEIPLSKTLHLDALKLCNHLSHTENETIRQNFLSSYPTSCRVFLVGGISSLLTGLYYYRSCSHQTWSAHHGYAKALFAVSVYFAAVGGLMTYITPWKVKQCEVESKKLQQEYHELQGNLAVELAIEQLNAALGFDLMQDA